ncbi:S26 family signal peptidase [Pseudomonas aeruginosa]|uniref:S26 family signal peptidase n=1 Tax=Pseudomonas aeruginosa TaxID=287 RepID=UPI00053D56C0|nr:S26 family signal peptidase [Pseudomonas aeruginosa]MBX5936384.1 S26 family signal peptidase [Pseudomonas aeruginosa]MCV3866938.1 S26 family signal peptidase [Pseudomonas aeruginosa]MCV3929587.1 S26 family signal peptidase [Pseudomonas aeruginosa]MEC6557789.1 S26 family signal peptidase [Pseudomonas aeruginosa]HCH0551076.1 S26 family signal peptidase [Pseudomonas aeruginosa]
MTAPTTTTAAVVPRPCSRLRFALAALAAGGLVALAWAAFVQPAVRIVYNPSDSVPVGWYRIAPAHALSGALPVDSIVLTTLPAHAAALAAQRGYLPSHIPLLKRVGAVAPQHVCIVNGLVRIDGVPVAAVLRADRWGRPLPSWPQCRPLAQGELFLLSVTNPASFDSRYFGPVSAAAVLGVAQPLHLEPQP